MRPNIAHCIAAAPCGISGHDMRKRMALRGSCTRYNKVSRQRHTIPCDCQLTHFDSSIHAPELGCDKTGPIYLNTTFTTWTVCGWLQDLALLTVHRASELRQCLGLPRPSPLVRLLVATVRFLLQLLST